MGTSIYKGVSWHKRSKKWQAYIYTSQKQYHIGNFNTEEEARKARDKVLKAIQNVDT